ncbi:hypothetical protein EYF80_037161 [Liparis tanakae]|uniref:Uncharacterized protein n=1 Tax=Liparis tanakae TaxID=230148 RepID=A0A4Z2GHH9_9TELE|nr:hypothetical protein EYF80_037161 [Liparis tanakae]
MTKCFREQNSKKATSTGQSEAEEGGPFEGKENSQTPVNRGFSVSTSACVPKVADPCLRIPDGPSCNALVRFGQPPPRLVEQLDDQLFVEVPVRKQTAGPPSPAEMFKTDKLKALVNERLKAAAEEIFRIFETTIQDYEEIVVRSKQEADQQRRKAPVQLSVQEEAPPPEQCHFKKTDLCEDDPEPPQIKEEQEEELWTAQADENQREEAETKDSMFNIIYVQRKDDDRRRFPRTNLEVENQGGRLPGSSCEQLKSEPGEEGCGASEPTSDCQMSDGSEDEARGCGGANGKRTQRADEGADRPPGSSSQHQSCSSFIIGLQQLFYTTTRKMNYTLTVLDNINSILSRGALEPLNTKKTMLSSELRGQLIAVR